MIEIWKLIQNFVSLTDKVKMVNLCRNKIFEEKNGLEQRKKCSIYRGWIVDDYREKNRKKKNYRKVIQKKKVATSRVK